MKNSYYILVIAFILFVCAIHAGYASTGDVQTIHLSDDVVAHVQVSLSGTVLSFPVKPTKVILGRAGTFGIDYVENDLAISPLMSNARSHLFVYLYGRRFSFDLSVSGSEGGSVILVRDALTDTRTPPAPTHLASHIKAVKTK